MLLLSIEDELIFVLISGVHCDGNNEDRLDDNDCMDVNID